MQFSSQQNQALIAVARWLKEGPSQVFRLFGYAGTGKTTIAHHLAAQADGEVQFTAFTGKAAQVLRANGAKNARTIHSLIYQPCGEEEIRDDVTGKRSLSPSFMLNRQSQASRVSLIVLDECSMVDERLGKDLLSFGTPVLVMGDPGQLPPISGGGFFTQSPPDFLLTEVHRQAFDNPVIRLALQVRSGQPLVYGDFGKARVIRQKELTSECLLSANQLLVGSNATKRSCNQKLRFLKQFSGEFPEAGDKLVCLRNDASKGLLNGSLWQVQTASPYRETGKHFHLVVLPEEEGIEAKPKKVKILADFFRNPGAEIPWGTRKRYDEFDYGYALTVHKAQGSQWNNVVLIDESFAFPETRSRWLYTAITRAVERLTIVH